MSHTVEAKDGKVEISVSGTFDAIPAKDLGEEILEASHKARGQVVDLLNAEGPIPPLTGGTADKEAEAAVERPGSDANREVPAPAEEESADAEAEAADDPEATQEIEVPSESMSRGDLNAAAVDAGVENPESLPNKAAVIEAIEAATS